MSENNFEGVGPSEKIPNEREVLNKIEEIVGSDYKIVRNLEDEHGLYMLEVETRDDAEDIVLHTFMRAGNYPEGSSLESRIDVVFYGGDIPMGGHLVAKYENGGWVKETK